MADPDPGDEQDRAGDDGEEHGRVEVGLEEDEPAEDDDDDEHRPQRRAPVVHLVVLAPGEEVGGEEDECELGELGGLEAPGADAEPAARPGDVDPEVRHQDEDEHRRGDEEQRLGPVAPASVVDARARPQKAMAPSTVQMSWRSKKYQADP